jgi:glycosyltransferase involved in cell wall biosynthesis
MRKILYISPSPHVKGGISSVIKGYLGSDLAKHHAIYLVASHVDGNKLVKLVRALTGLLETLFYLLIKGIDIVHVHGGDIISFKRKFYYVKIAKFLRCKLIYHHHGADFMSQYKSLSKKWKNRVKRTFEQVDLLICLSNTWRDRIQSIAPGGTIEVVPNCINLPHTFWKKANSHVQLAFLGLIGDRKGVFDLLKVIKRLINDAYDIRLTIAGNGEVMRLLREINELEIANAVKYCGWIGYKERDLILRETDIFVLPSYAEGMPMSILEAMAYSVPVVSTFVGGIPELVIDGETGCLFKSGDLDEMYGKIAYLVQDENLRKEMGRKGRELISTNHNIRQAAQKVSAIYNSL